HGLELIEGGAVHRLDRDRRFRIVAIDDHAIALDRFHDMERWSQPLICDRGVECSKVDRTYRFGAEHKRIIPQTFAINLRFQSKITKAIETDFGFAFYASVEEMDGCKIARVLQRGPQGESPPGTAVIILRCPVIAAAADGRQRDRIVTDQR